MNSMAVQTVITYALAILGPVVIVGMYWAIEQAEKRRKSFKVDKEVVNAFIDIWKSMPDSCKDHVKDQLPKVYKVVAKYVEVA